MIKLLISILILTVGFIVGILIGLSTPDWTKSQWVYTIKKDMQEGKKVFMVGNDLQFKKTKFRKPIIYTVEVKEKNE